MRTAYGLAFLAVSFACSAAPAPVVPEPAAAAAWRTLFDGTSLDGWRATAFGGEGPVTVEAGRMILEMGSPLTGVTWDGAPLPTLDYEVELDAARVAGSDFFCALTFPVGDSHASLVLGGWGGSLCGISSLDGKDASENETTEFLYLETGKHHAVRLRVTAARIEAWLDGDVLVDVPIAGREVSIRPEMDRSRPFGIASFATRAAIGPVRIRSIGSPGSRSG